MASLRPASAPELPHALAARARRISVSATAALLKEASRLREAGRDLVDFGVGEPDFPTPEHITAAGIEALRSGYTKYTPIPGSRELRAAIAAAHRRDFGSDYTAEETLVTNGGKQALFEAVSVLVDHGDEVIVPAPYWVSFCDQIAYAGGTPVVVATDAARGFGLDAEAIARAVTPRTRMILLNSPANPSGAVFAPAAFRAVLELCRERRLWLLSDECYVKLVYDDAPYSVAGEAGAKECVIVAGSLSKTYAMTGWRIGYALGPEPVITAMTNLQSHSTSNANSIAQRGALAALTGPQEPVARMVEEYRERRRLIVEGLRAVAGVRCAMPAGTFYAFPEIRGLLGRRGGPATALAFAGRLLQEAGVVTAPGEAFGWEGHIRFSYATSRAVIAEGLRRFAEYCRLLK